MVRKVIKAGVQKIGRGLRSGKAKIDAAKDLKAAKAKTTRAKKPKTVKRSEAPIQSERSKITAANKTAANTRQSKSIANKAMAAKPTIPAALRAKKAGLPVGSKRAIATAGTAILGASLLNKKKPAAPKTKTFAEAFKEARAKGEGTNFTHDGKKYVAVTKTDLKKKGYDSNELAAYNKRGGKARGPLNRLGQKAKKVLLGKDKKFGGDKGAIDFIRKPVKKAGGGMLGPHPQQGRPMNIAAPQGPRAQQPLRNMAVPYGKIAKKGPGLKNGGSVKKYKAGGSVKTKACGAAKRGYGKAYMKGKR